MSKDRVATRPGNVSKVYTDADMILDPNSPYQRHNGDICGNRDPGRHCTVSTTTGWRPNCECFGRFREEKEWVEDRSEEEGGWWRTYRLYEPVGPQPAPVRTVVLDPFSGSGTTGVVANALGRNYIGLDLNREYIGMAQRRIARPHAPIQRPGKEEHHPLFGEPDVRQYASPICPKCKGPRKRDSRGQMRCKPCRKRYITARLCGVWGWGNER